MNVLIPMAGRGSRMAGTYVKPKPLIDVFGRPMITRVLENIVRGDLNIFVVLDYHKEDLTPILHAYEPCVILGISKPTLGAACTCLLAKEYINNDTPLLVANCDQIMDWNKEEFLSFVNGKMDGCIITFTSDSPNKSYVELDGDGNVRRAVEKEVISSLATTGVYYWSRGRDMVASCERMIEKDIRCNNEFYLCPSYNEMIEDGMIIKTFHVNACHSTGTPEELKEYLNENR